MKMIEVETINGFRRLINVKSIAQVSELTGSSGSNVVIVMESGETIFAADSYEDVKAQVLVSQGGNE